MNGTTCQSVAGDLDTIAQLQLRMRGPRESHGTNGSLVRLRLRLPLRLRLRLRLHFWIQFWIQARQPDA